MKLRGMNHAVVSVKKVLLVLSRYFFGSLAALLMVVLVWSAQPEPVQTPESVRLIPAEGDGHKYWPRWRGPSGQGIVPGSGYPDTWSETENVLWKTEVPGRGVSSPIVWDNQIFLTTSRDQGRRISILSYRKSDGQLLWETFVPPGKPERIYRKNTHASATPSTDGERIYASFGSQGVVAMDFQGNMVWHSEVGDITNYHGSAGSPFLYKDRIFIYQDQRRNAFVAAFDKLTGQEIWRTKRTARVGWGTPIVIQTRTHNELIVSGQGRVQAYDPESGVELWSCKGNLTEVIPTPVVGHGLVFCVSGRAGPTLAIRPGGNGDVTSTHLEWTTSKGSSFVPSALIYGEFLYMINDITSVATCYRASTGELMWQGRLGRTRREGFSASPIGVDGKVFFTNDFGETFVLQAGIEFKLLHVNRLNAQTLASPALLDQKWYFRTDRHLLSIGQSGK